MAPLTKYFSNFFEQYLTCSSLPHASRLFRTVRFEPQRLISQWCLVSMTTGNDKFSGHGRSRVWIPGKLQSKIGLCSDFLFDSHASPEASHKKTSKAIAEIDALKAASFLAKANTDKLRPESFFFLPSNIHRAVLCVQSYHTSHLTFSFHDRDLGRRT